MAGLLCVWVGILATFRGSLTFTNHDGASYHASTIAALYLLAGVTTGAIVGGLRGLLRRPAGAVALGAFAALPFGAGIFATRTAFAPWGRIEIISLLIFSLAFGGGGGLIIREFVAPNKRS